MSNTAARIVSLRRYISLLQQEEKRLKWILASTVAPNPERANAETDVRVISGKLINAEQELAELELKRST
jgi:hypothetical protein